MDEQQDHPVQDNPDEPKIGVYVCRCGGNISDYLDTEGLAKTAATIHGVTVSTVDSFMCSDPGQSLIVKDVKEGKVDRVVVASCSPFLHEMTFQAAVKRGGLNPYLYAHVNIREQGSWAHGHQGAEATHLALLNIAAGIGKVRHLAPLEKIRMPCRRRVLVIGGGVAGMKAAIDVAGHGLPVLLVESSGKLGGRAANLGKTFPTGLDGSDLIARLQREVDAEKLITTMTNSRVTGIDGFLGNFDVVIEQQDDDDTHPIGAIIIATGFDPYQPANGEYGFGNPQVATLPEFTQTLRETQGGRLEWKGKRVRSVAMIHCVGSRQCEGVFEPQADGNINTYCSRICCTSLLRTAVEVRERFPQTSVYDFHQDIRTYGRGQEAYYTRASELGVTFFRWNSEDPPVVSQGSTTPLRVQVKDQLTFGEEIEVPVDLVVLGIGMMPSKINDIIDMLKLPIGEDRFLQEVHPKLRPVEMAVAGVLLAGTSQGPMSIEESLQGASAAASKAAIFLANDYTDLEPFVANVKPDLCIGCSLCIDECSYAGAIITKTVTKNGSEVRVAEVNSGLCKGCGACVAVCPTRAIDLQGWSLEQFDAMVDGIVSELEMVEA